MRAEPFPRGRQQSESLLRPSMMRPDRREGYGRCHCTIQYWLFVSLRPLAKQARSNSLLVRPSLYSHGRPVPISGPPVTIRCLGSHLPCPALTNKPGLECKQERAGWFQVHPTLEKTACFQNPHRLTAIHSPAQAALHISMDSLIRPPQALQLGHPSLAGWLCPLKKALGLAEANGCCGSRLDNALLPSLLGWRRPKVCRQLFGWDRSVAGKDLSSASRPEKCGLSAPSECGQQGSRGAQLSVGPRHFGPQPSDQDPFIGPILLLCLAACARPQCRRHGCGRRNSLRKPRWELACLPPPPDVLCGKAAEGGRRELGGGSQVSNSAR